MNKKRWMSLALALSLVAAGAGSYAYFTVKDRDVNAFTVGDVDISLEEVNWEDAFGQNVYPGDIVYKEVTVTNTTDREGPCPAYLRMTVKITEPDGTLITDPERLALIEKTIRFDPLFVEEDEDAEYYLLENDTSGGYSLAFLDEHYAMVNPIFEEYGDMEKPGVLVFEYKGDKDSKATIGDKTYEMVLKKDEAVMLFSCIVFPNDWTQTEFEKVGAFNLDITAQAIQAEGFRARNAAFGALPVLT